MRRPGSSFGSGVANEPWGGCLFFGGSFVEVVFPGGIGAVILVEIISYPTISSVVLYGLNTSQVVADIRLFSKKAADWNQGLSSEWRMTL